MTEKEIQGIVTEVIRRIRQRIEAEHTLVILRRPADAGQAEAYLRTAGQAAGADVYAVCASDAAHPALPDDLQTLVRGHSAVLLVGVTCGQLTRIRQMRMEDPLVEVTAEALRQGKPVTVVSDWLDTTHCTAGFASVVHTLRQGLADWGVTFVDPRQPNRDLCSRKADAGVQNMSCVRIDRRVVAKQDLKEIQGGILEIREDAVLTTTAKALLTQRGVQVIRYQI